MRYTHRFCKLNFIKSKTCATLNFVTHAHQKATLYLSQNVHLKVLPSLSIFTLSYFLARVKRFFDFATFFCKKFYCYILPLNNNYCSLTNLSPKRMQSSCILLAKYNLYLYKLFFELNNYLYSVNI